MKARTDLPALDAIRAIEPEMLATRHRIHANPELAFVGDGPKRLGLRADRDDCPSSWRTSPPASRFQASASAG